MGISKNESNFCIFILDVGDIDKFLDIVGMSHIKLSEHISKFVNFFSKYAYVISALPDRGIAYFLIKEVVRNTGRSAVGVAPLSDVDFGIDHLKTYIRTSVNNFPLFDPIIDTYSWYRHDLIAPLTCDAVLVLGLSLGTVTEIAGSLYMYKVLKHKKPRVSVDPTHISKHIRAGTKIPFTIFLYEPLMLSDLPIELYKYAEDVGARIIKIKSPEEIENYL